MWEIVRLHQIYVKLGIRQMDQVIELPSQAMFITG